MKLKVFTAFSGYDSQLLSLQRLKNDYQDFDFECVGWSEIDKYAIKAHNALFPELNNQNYGDITSIDWNNVPDFDLLTWSFPCFVAGTLIHTQDGYVPIENVKVGDFVLSHDNEYHRVLEIGCKSNAPIIKIRAMCFYETMCTPNHPFYVRKRYRCGRKMERRFMDAEWLAAKDITKDHFIGYAINQKSELPKWEWQHDFDKRFIKPQPCKLTPLFEKPEFWYLMGRYVGDGWKKNNKVGSGIVICCSNRNEKSLLDAISACGFHRTISPDRTVTKVIISMNELNIFVNRYGYHAIGKKVDEETMNLPIHLLEGFVRGYVDSDGCYTATEYKATSISKTLMYGIQQCVSKVYKMPVKLIFCKRPEHVTIEGRVCNQHDSYNMAWHTEKRVQDKAFYENGYVWFPIKEVVDIKQTATVYNMEVEDSHTYTANGAIVHNCTNISSAGKQAGFSAGSGTSSSLCWDCLKGIEIKRPKYLLMENVKALSHKRFMPDFIKIQMKLESFGYTNFWAILNSKDHGVPQNRERIFMVSIINEGDYQFPDSYKLTKRLRDIMEDNVPEEYYLNEKQIKRIIEHCDRKVSEGCGFKTNFVTPDDISGTIKTKEGQREYDTYIKIDNRLRRLTPRECFRLMGVGDTDIDTIQSTNISKSQQYKLAGNSIVVNVLYDIFKSLFIENKNTSTEKQLELF